MQSASVVGLQCGAKTQTRRLAKKRETPRYKLGETLYVKEAIEWTGSVTTRNPIITRDAAVYQADRARCPLDAWPWTRDVLSAMFMPQGLRRIEVTITEVRRQRLQQITEADAVAEGIAVCLGLLDEVEIYAAAKRFGGMATDLRIWYLTAWEDMHGGRDRHGNPRPTSARANPLVDAYTFTVRKC